MTHARDDALGLARGHVRIIEPTPRWAELLVAEAACLAAALEPCGARVEHCGSTSVPHLPAKPILDLLVGVATPVDGSVALYYLVRGVV